MQTLAAVQTPFVAVAIAIRDAGWRPDRDCARIVLIEIALAATFALIERESDRLSIADAIVHSRFDRRGKSSHVLVDIFLACHELSRARVDCGTAIREEPLALILAQTETPGKIHATGSVVSIEAQDVATIVAQTSLCRPRRTGLARLLGDDIDDSGRPIGFEFRRWVVDDFDLVDLIGWELKKRVTGHGARKLRRRLTVDQDRDAT